MSNEILCTVGPEDPSPNGTTSAGYLFPAIPEAPPPRPTFKDALYGERDRLASLWMQSVKRDFEAAGGPLTLDRTRLSAESCALWEKLMALDKVIVLWGFAAAPQPSAEKAAADVLAGRRFDLSQ